MTSSAYNPARRAGLYAEEDRMAESTWPLRNKHLAESFAFITKGEMGEMLSEFDDDTAI